MEAAFPAAMPEFLAEKYSNETKSSFRFIDCNPQMGSFLGEVLRGLQSRPKTLNPKFFYDERGSQLFEQICELDEYYPTRTETAILGRHAADLKRFIGDDSVLVEFGSGSSRKIRILLDALSPSAYMMIEISREALLQASEQLSSLYPELDLVAVCADFCQPLPAVGLPSGRRLAFFPGSTIGNFTPEDALSFLKNTRQLVGPRGGLLIGVDMKKDAARLQAAYNDSRGVTAAFNLNLLHRMNRELGADFDVANFRHHAFYNEQLGRIEMHLVSERRQQVHIGEQVITFEAGESIHTENSYKYTPAEFSAMAMRAGFEPVQVWMDSNRLFSVHYLKAC